MPYLLNIAYLLFLVCAAPWLACQALRKGKYREGFAAKLLGRVPVRRSDRPCAWFHAVSVGEVNLLVPLVARFSERYPAWECVISTTTMTGYRLAQTKFAASVVFYCPLDFTWAVRTALRRIRPSLLVLAELELWPNLITSARAAGVRVAVVNGRVSDRSFRGYGRLKFFIGRLLGRIDLIAAQNSEYADRFCRLGAAAQKVHVTGSIKFDGAQADRNNSATLKLRQLANFRDEDVVFLAGSTQEPEEQLALEAFRRLSLRFPRLRLVLVPRHPDRFDRVAELLDNSAMFWQRRSRLEQFTPDARTRIILVDRIGELGAWWGAAHIAFVGGSLGRRGGQNMIEPAAYGAAVSFGPNTQNFRDVVAMLLDAQAAVVVRNQQTLMDFVACCLEDPAFAAELGARAKSVVAEQVGATRRTLDLLASIMPAELNESSAGRNRAA